MHNDVVKYKRGSVWFCDLGFNDKGVQSGSRPVLVISNDEGNKSGTQISVLAITSKDKSYLPINVLFKNDKGEDNNILCNQVFTVSKDNLEDYQYQISDSLMDRVESSFIEAMGIKTFSSSIDKFDEVIQKIVDAKTRLAEQNLSKVTEDKLLHMAQVLEDLFKDTLAMPVSERQKDEVKSEAPLVSSYIDAVVRDDKKIDEVKEEKEKSSDRKPHGFWTPERMKQFIHDKETMRLTEVREKWNIPNNQKVTQTYYSLKARMNKLGIL